MPSHVPSSKSVKPKSTEKKTQNKGKAPNKKSHSKSTSAIKHSSSKRPSPRENASIPSTPSYTDRGPVRDLDQEERADDERGRSGFDFAVFPWAILGFFVGLLFGAVIALLFGFCFCVFLGFGDVWRDRRKRAFLIGFIVGVLMAIIIYVALVVAIVVNDNRA